MLASAGQVDEAVPYLARAYRQDPRWAALVPRLPAAGLLPAEAVTDLVVRMKAPEE